MHLTNKLALYSLSDCFSINLFDNTTINPTQIKSLGPGFIRNR